MPYEPGQSGNPAGRPPGIPNKTTIAVKLAFEQAFEGVGGVEAFTKWAKDNQTEFYKLYSKLLPKDFKVSADLTLEELLLGRAKQQPPQSGDQPK